MTATNTPILDLDQLFPVPAESLANADGRADAPKAFLREHAWKAFLAEVTTETTKSPRRTTDLLKPATVKAVKFSLAWPDTFTAQDQHLGTGVVEAELYRHRAVIAQALADLDPNLLKPGTTPTVECLKTSSGPLRHSDVWSRKVRGRTIGEWAAMWVRGRAFATALKKETQQESTNRFVFLEELYVPPRDYAEIRKAFLESYECPVFIEGMPKTGKTYTALQLLYEGFVQQSASVYLIEQLAHLGPRLDEIQERFQLQQQRRKQHSQPTPPPPTLILLDDPFGSMHPDPDTVHDFERGLRRITEIVANSNYPHSIRLVVTSREQVAHAVRRSHSVSFALKTFKFDLRGSDNQPLYSQSSLQKILRKTAWFQNARWLASMEEVIENTADDPMGWRNVINPTCPPGSILAALLLRPYLGKFDGKKPEHVTAINAALARAEDMRSAADSELMAGYGEDQPTKDRTAVQLYLLLPALTLVTQELREALFTQHELAALADFDGLFEYQPPPDNAFEKPCYRYVHEAVAEAAQEFILAAGPATVLSFFPRVTERLTAATSSPALVDAAVDLLATYRALGGRSAGTFTQVHNLSDGITHRDPEAGEWANFVGAFFHTEVSSVAYQDAFFSHLWKQVPRLSAFATLVDQLLCVRSRGQKVNKAAMGESPAPHPEVGKAAKEDELPETIRTFMPRLVRKVLASDKKDRPASPHLHVSLALHGLLSHLEEWLPANQATDVPNSKLSMLLGAPEFANRPGGTERDWLNAVIVWLDAVLMKVGELEYACTLEADILVAIQESGGDTLKSTGENALFSHEHIADGRRILRDLTAALLPLWEQAERISSESSDAEYFRGALAFSAVWHNRWRATQDTTTELHRKLDEVVATPSVSDRYWEGVVFNIRYHAAYFLAKADAWGRENAIYLWRRNSPRRGANELYECGLPEHGSRRSEQAGIRDRNFFHECFKRFISDPLAAVDGTFDRKSLRAAVFVMGMRAHRHQGLDKEFHDAIARSPRAGADARNEFWIGIAHLYTAGIKDAVRLIGDAIRAHPAPAWDDSWVKDLRKSWEKRVPDFPDGNLGDITVLYQDWATAARGNP